MVKIKMLAAIFMFVASGIAYADEATVQALEKRCDAAREAKLKPLREAEIARCKKESRSDANYCETYWHDYGDAIRLPNGLMQPRMFNDLPECVAADDARHKLNLGN